MNLLSLYKSEAQSETDAMTMMFPSRAEILGSIRDKSACDVVVVGGGIHGAAFARLAAFNGLSTVLFERDDYAFGTSSRSSKMAHGGLRYLEMLDFKQVIEGIIAREELFEVAHHLVKPTRFLIPVPAHRKFFKWKMGLGLYIYDLMVKRADRRHAWLPWSEVPPGTFNPLVPLEGCYSYTDGLLNDSRLVIENIVAARQEGAICINHASVDHFKLLDSGQVEVGWTDLLRGEKSQLKCGLVINCAGPWVPNVGRVTPSDLSNRIKYSQGVHLIFNTPWNKPALFLPLPRKGQYYFVWPHFAGTMVGTTEREVDQPPRDPLPTSDEVEEILERLRRDLPDAGLDRTTLHYAFAGVRTLPLRKKNRSSLKLSRKHSWTYSGGVLNLIGGKYTTHAWTVYEGLKQTFKLAHLGRQPVSLRDRKLPGAGNYEDTVQTFRRAAEEKGVPEAIIQRTISRLGSRVKFIAEKPTRFEVVGGLLLRGEVELALQIEQAETLDDLMRRRLDLEYMDGYGLAALPGIVSILQEFSPTMDVNAAITDYKERIATLRQIMGLAPLTHQSSFE